MRLLDWPERPCRRLDPILPDVNLRPACDDALSHRHSHSIAIQFEAALLDGPRQHILEPLLVRGIQSGDSEDELETLDEFIN